MHLSGVDIEGINMCNYFLFTNESSRVKQKCTKEEKGAMRQEKHTFNSIIIIIF